MPERKAIQIGEVEELNDSNSSVHSSIKLGTYAGRLANLNLAGMNNPIPNLTNVYLDTPLVGQTPEPLEYVSLPGRLGQPNGYPQLVQEVALPPVVPKGVPLPHPHCTALTHG